MQQLFVFRQADENPERLIGDKAYDSDHLGHHLGRERAQQDIELIAPHRANRKPESKTREARAYDWLDPEIPTILHFLGEIDAPVLRLPSFGLYTTVT